MRLAGVVVLLALVAVVVQTAVFPLLPVLSVPPDLLLILCVYLGLYVHSPAGAVGAFAIGYIEDSFSGTLPGLNAFAMSVVFVGVYLTSRRLWVENAVSRIVLVFVAALLKAVAMMVLIGAFLSLDGLWRTVVRYVFFEALLAAALSPPIFALLARTHPAAVSEAR